MPRELATGLTELVEIQQGLYAISPIEKPNLRYGDKDATQVSSSSSSHPTIMKTGHPLVLAIHPWMYYPDFRNDKKDDYLEGINHLMQDYGGNIIIAEDTYRFNSTKNHLKDNDLTERRFLIKTKAQNIHCSSAEPSEMSWDSYIKMLMRLREGKPIQLVGGQRLNCLAKNIEMLTNSGVPFKIIPRLTYGEKFQI